jgi:DNA repair photolyase
LKEAHDEGIKTWVSLEPVLNPETSLQIIRETHTFVDKFKVGLLNYHPLAKTIDWIKFRANVVNLLDNLHCNYYIKNDLKNYAVR